MRRSLPNALRPSPLLQLEDLPPHSLGMFHAVSGDIFGIPTPQPFQYVEACHYICNDDTVLVVPVCTADGKALIVQLAGFFYRGVVFYKDPFLDLATARVERATATEHNIWGVSRRQAQAQARGPAPPYQSLESVQQRRCRGDPRCDQPTRPPQVDDGQRVLPYP